MHATIDIVTRATLAVFAAKRRSDVQRLISVLDAAYDEVAACFEKSSVEELSVSQGARGVLGLHPLFRELQGAQGRIEGPARDESN